MKKNILLSVVVLLFMVHCADVDSSNVESATFSLDQGDYDAAISKLTSFLTANPGNVEATQLLSSAYFGRSNLRDADLVEAMLDLDVSTLTNFGAIADVLPSDGVLADIRSAITTLEGLTGVDGATLSSEALEKAVFDLAFYQLIEHFAVGVYQSNFLTGTFDVTGITEAGRAAVQSDLVAFDNRMIAAGVDSTENYLSEIRQTFCILEPISAAAGFTLEEYQAFVGCQLSTSPATFNTAAITAAIATCAALEPGSQTAAVESCYDSNSSL